MDPSASNKMRYWCFFLYWHYRAYPKTASLRLDRFKDFFLNALNMRCNVERNNFEIYTKYLFVLQILTDVDKYFSIFFSISSFLTTFYMWHSQNVFCLILQRDRHLFLSWLIKQPFYNVCNANFKRILSDLITQAYIYNSHTFSFYFDANKLMVFNVASQKVQ